MLEQFLYASLLFKLTFIAYAISAIFYLAIFFSSNKYVKTIAKYSFVVAFALSTTLITTRWIDAGRPPFKSLYESLVFAVWTVSAVNIFVEFKLKVRLLGSLSAISILIIFLYALSKRDAEIISLPPALQTWIFIPHVMTYFMAYGALLVAGLSAILQLIFPDGIKGHHSINDEEEIHFSEYTYSIARFGYLFLTIGLLLGAWWGQEAWSNYWGWDPKENWALISWLFFGAYFHLKKMRIWSEKKLSWLVIIGVVIIGFTYLGMDYLPTADQSLHIYIED
jgi:cytochrome c-type biogenesis protein CcsB